MNKLIAWVIPTAAVLLTGCEQSQAPAETGLAAAGPVSVTLDTGAPARVYFVAEGDEGFADIAEKVYGDAKYWRLIAEGNPGVDPRMLKPGDELFIPLLSAEDGDE